MSPLNSPRVNCPHCGEKVGFFNRIQKCAVTEEMVCRKCIVSERFSDSIAKDVPAEFREKFRFYNALPFAIVVIIGLLVLQHSWWGFGGWRLEKLTLLFNNLLTIFEFIILGLVILLSSIKLPHLGTWMFYWWIGHGNNREKVKEAIELNKKGEYRSTDKIYNFKIKFIDYIKSTNAKHILFTAIILQITFVILFIIMKAEPQLSGTYFSAFSGAIYSITLFFNLLIILMAYGFYSRRTADNYKQRMTITAMIWSYILLLPLTFIILVLGIISQLGGASDELHIPGPTWAMPVFYILFFIGQALMVLLPLYMYKKGQPVWELEEHPKKKRDPGENIWKYMLKQLPKTTLAIIFFAILVLILSICLLILVVDPTLALGILLSTYLLVGIFFPIIFINLKLVPRRPKKYSQFYWTITKISVIIVGISVIPGILTPLWTNPSIEMQFDQQFGSDWRSKIPANLSATMRQVPYSAFENFFGFDIPLGDARYDVVYCQDSPRYVKNATTGEILANGTTKYSAILHNFTMDAYLPPGYKFGDGKPEKFPIIIFCHGSGMAKGPGNANMTVTRYLASQGYLVVDMMYGFHGWAKSTDTDKNKKRGYDYPDTMLHVANVTKFLWAHRDEYHADLSNVYFAGRSLGGWMAATLTFASVSDFFGSNFSEHMVCRGGIPFYGAHGILDGGSDLLNSPLIQDLVDTNPPYVRGSSHPDDPDYNPEWIYYDPFKMAEQIVLKEGKQLPPVFLIHGTQDPLVPPGWDQRLQAELLALNQTAIAAFYPLGSHAADAMHFSQYGQSILYYMERFLALTRQY
ncbi:MAG: hypothetical protein ACTSU2_04110 [Promethearchaeota archaeon]